MTLPQNGHEIISPRIYIQFYMNNFEKTNMALVTGILLKKKSYIAFACNAKNFAIAFLVLLPYRLQPRFGRTEKSCMHMFHCLLIRTRVTIKKLFSLETPAKAFVSML